MSGNLYGKGNMTSTSNMTENKLNPPTISEVVMSISKIMPRIIYVTALTISDSTVTLAPTATKQLSVTVVPTNADDKTVIWSSNIDAKATVSSTGLVTAVADGEVIITATANDGSGIVATCTVTVETPAP